MQCTVADDAYSTLNKNHASLERAIPILRGVGLTKRLSPDRGHACVIEHSPGARDWPPEKGVCLSLDGG